MKKCVLTLAAAAAVLFGTTSPASAQSTTKMPTFELSAGYQWLKSTGDVDQSFPFGLAVDGVRNFGALGIVAEGGWSMDSDDEAPNDLMFNFFHVGGGIRYTARKHPRLWPYAQVIVGAAIDHTSGDIGGIDVGDILTETTNTHFMVQPGGGVNWVAGDGWGIFGAVDYRRVFLDEETDGSSGLNQVRVFVGVRMILD